MLTWDYEREAAAQGYGYICGVDEAGRGPLAGPVYAGAVILPENTGLEGLNDSKKLSPKKRDQLYDAILQVAVDYAVASATVEEIESVNILNATFLAMKRAVDSLRRKDYALVDGNMLPERLPVPAKPVIGGDGLSVSIAAASILAKVSRDRYMLELDRQYPVYQFAKHKGYGTKAHIEILKREGPCPAHRMSFLKKILRG